MISVVLLTLRRITNLIWELKVKQNQRCEGFLVRMTFLSFNLYFWSMQGYYFYCLIFRKAATQSIISRDWDFTKLGIGGLDKVCFPTFNVYGNNLLHSTGTQQNIKLHTIKKLRSVVNTVWLQPSHFRGDLQFISPHHITTLPSGRLMSRQKKKKRRLGSIVGFDTNFSELE